MFQFEIIGEAAKSIPEDMMSLAPYIPWNNIASMRNRLIHAYFNVDFDLVWDNPETELTVLESRIEFLFLELHKGIEHYIMSFPKEFMP